MPVRLIAHQILKQQHRKECDCVLREAVLPADESLSVSFVQELRNALSHRNPIAARFARTESSAPPFERRLERYLGRRTDSEFVSFTRDATKLLQSFMATESAASGGYVVFIDYEQTNETFLLVALLSTAARAAFDARLNLVAADALDLEHLRFAGRVRCAAMRNNEDGVVHFVSRRTDGVSDYFSTRFLGCVPITDPSAQGRQLFSALVGLADVENLATEARQSLLQATYSYWADCRRSDRPMTLTGLANALRPERPATILQHLAAESVGLAGEFSPPTPKVMRRFVKFAFAGAGLRLEFDRDDWLDAIAVREHSVTIRNAPPQLLQMLTEEKNGR